MIDKITYEEMESYSKELEASADVLKSLIENKELKELENFVNAVYNYADYLASSVELYKSADEALEYLKGQKGTSN